MRLSNPEGAHFLIVGLIRNGAQALPHSLQSLKTAFSFGKKTSFLIIESDSSDQTCHVLEKLSLEYPNIQYVSLGNLSETYPKRTERLSFCRNYYLKRIHETPDYQDVDYLVIADLDGVNHAITEEAVRSCWKHDDWDVCTANQTGPYYDIWALRHPQWSPNDCWQQAFILQKKGLSQFKAVYSSVISRMICISPDAQWIEVESAFGGLAIYRREILESVQYNGLSQANREVCEHVSMHAQIRSKGGRIFINPQMVNASIVDNAFYATRTGIVFFWLRSQIHYLSDTLKKMPLIKSIWSFFKR